MQLDNYHIILGSGSPRRRDLLQQMGFDFEVISSQCEEQVDPSWSFSYAAEQLALQKALAFKTEVIHDNVLLITADTVVCSGESILGKPASRDEAIAMIKSLSGVTHHVITGVCLRTQNRTTCFHVKTSVTFAKLTEEEIIHYIDHYEPFDKAGAYGIQEWIGLIGVEHIEGSYFNVMGLPTHRLYKELKNFVNK